MRFAFPIAFFAVCLFLAFFFALADMGRILTIVPDDAAYYFGIARHAAAGDGLTFDGINRTNGFQPLWLYALTAVFAAHRGSSEEMFRIAIILQLALLAGAGLLLGLICGALYSRGAALVSGSIFVFFVLVPAANGMESAILVLCLALLFHFGWRAEVFARPGAGRAFAFGALLGLVLLARLDMVFLAVSIAAFVLARAAADPRARGARLRRFAAIAGGSATPVVPYLVYNRVSFGSVMPVSGAIKSSFPAISLSPEAVSSLGKAGAAGIVLAVLYLAWFLARRGRPDGEKGYFRAGLAAMAAASIMHLLHTLLFMKWAVFTWHFIPYVLFAALMACEPLEAALAAAPAKRRSLIAGLVAAAIAATGVFAAYRSYSRPLDRTWNPAAYEAARWARESTPSDAVFAMKDAGNFGYFSERSVINLDGVVNTLDFQEVLRGRTLAAYLRRAGVRYMVQHAFWNRPDIVAGSYDSYAVRYTSNRYDSESDEIRLYRADETYRSRPYFDGPYETVFIVWTYRTGG